MATGSQSGHRTPPQDIIHVRLISMQRGLLVEFAGQIAQTAEDTGVRVDGPDDATESSLGPGCWTTAVNIFDPNAATLEALGHLECPGVLLRIRPTDSIPEETDYVTEPEEFSLRFHTLFELGEYELAVKEISKAIDRDCRNTETLSNRGYTYAQLGESELAIKDYNEALRIDPDYPIALVNRGLELAKLGQTEASERDINRALELGYTE